MLKIKLILEKDENIFNYLVRRGLLAQYKKAKQKIISWIFNELSLREPKSDGVWYFRINKQFRAYALLKDKDVFVVYRIDNHQKD